MKSLFSMLLVGLMALQTTGCAAIAASPTPKQKDSDAASASQEDAAERLADNYKITIDLTEKEMSALSGEISTMPVQPRPATEQLESLCSAYIEKIDDFQAEILNYRAQIDADEDSGALDEDSYDALTFQCDQLDARVETMRSALNVVFGVDIVNTAA